MPLDEAMLTVLDETVLLMCERGIGAPLRFAAVLADGEQLMAFRMSTDSKPPTLYLRRCCSGTIVASEPLGDDLDNPEGHDDCHWQLLPAGATVVIDRSGSRFGQHRLTAAETADSALG
jgi:glutamine amidotransferase